MKVIAENTCKEKKIKITIEYETNEVTETGAIKHHDPDTYVKGEVEEAFEHAITELDADTREIIDIKETQYV